MQPEAKRKQGRAKASQPVYKAATSRAKCQKHIKAKGRHFGLSDFLVR
jgi:hypothetical protein